MKFSSKSPTKTVKQPTSISPNQVQKKVTHNYVEKTLVNKEVEYWKFKYMELEQFCQGKQSYEKLENELQIWKSKYQQLTLRARVAKGSELIIQEYQSRIQELNQQFNSNNYNSTVTFSPSKRSEQTKQNELQYKIDQQQNEIRSLQNQIEELKQQSKQHTKRDIIIVQISQIIDFNLIKFICTTTNNSNYQSQNMFANSSSLNQQYIQQNMRLELELKNIEQENQSLQEQIQFYQHNLESQQKIIDQQKLHINQLEQNLASEKLKQLKLMDQNAINLKEQEITKYQEEIFILSSKLRECEKQKRQELNQKDEHYQEIISQLKLQIHNQIQSGEMRLIQSHFQSDLFAIDHSVSRFSFIILTAKFWSINIKQLIRNPIIFELINILFRIYQLKDNLNNLQKILRNPKSLIFFSIANTNYNLQQNILQDKQLNSSFGRLNTDFYQQQHTNQSDKVIVRLDSEMKNLKSLINEDNNKQRFF